MKITLPFRKAGPPLKRPPKLKLRASVARSRRAPIVEEEDFLEEPEPNMKLSHAFVVVLVLHVIAVAGVFAFNSIKAQRADIFSAIKEEPAKAATATETSVAAVGTAAPTTPASPASPEPAKPIAPAPAPAAAAKTHELMPGETLTKVAATYDVSIADLQAANKIEDPKRMRPGMILVIPGASAPAPAAVADSATVSYKPVTARSEEPVQPTPAPAKPVEAEPAAVAATVADAGKTYVVVKGDNPWKIAKRLKVSYADLISLNGIDPKKLQIGQTLKIPAAK